MAIDTYTHGMNLQNFVTSIDNELITISTKSEMIKNDYNYALSDSFMANLQLHLIDKNILAKIFFLKKVLEDFNKLENTAANQSIINAAELLLKEMKEVSE